MILWDQQSCIPLSNILDGDGEAIITLLTPVVVPLDRFSAAQDPFEPFGRALASRHPRVRHVPYTKKSGITSTHVAFIKRARVIIFVISGPQGPGEISQVEFAETAQLIAEHRPQIILACFSVQPHQLPGSTFPTIVQISGYGRPDLEAAASLLFGGYTTRQPIPANATQVARQLAPSPQYWQIDELNPKLMSEKDMDAIHELWTESLPLQFRLNRFVLRQLLGRDGFAKHYIVRESGNGLLLGFCATYTTYLHGISEHLVGSLAMLLVRLQYRRRGIGRSLHDHAFEQLKKLRGVGRLQLGTTFPRLLYGLPVNLPSQTWFGQRGWEYDQPLPGRGQEVCDWLLNFKDMPAGSFNAEQSGLTFRPCSVNESKQVLDIVHRESVRKECMSWWDAYNDVMETTHVQDIILGLEGDLIVATALTYLPGSGSTISNNIPWPRSIGEDVGGVTCICITGTRNISWRIFFKQKH